MDIIETCGDEAPVPADHSRDALIELAADCCLAPGHDGSHHNGNAWWSNPDQAPQKDRSTFGKTVADRADFLTAMLGDISSESADVVFGAVVLSVLALGVDASDADVLADALLTLDGLFDAFPAVTS
ncbi:hypothetical protein ABZS81_00445 [Streptomyces sp. NPDC005318]|uniref:hypothetical protein n=1 Tax=Streptomyces sp. NPDC005318 TaxID=3157031 RepID=UPI0033A292E4